MRSKRIESGICPICGNDLDYGNGFLGNHGYRYFQDVSCPRCGFTGREIFNLSYEKTVDYDTGEEFIKESCGRGKHNEATNCGNVGSYKRSSIDLIPNIEDGNSRFDVDEDDIELLVELEADESDDDDIEDQEIEVSISDIVDDTDEGIDGENSTDPIEKQLNKSNADNSISI